MGYTKTRTDVTGAVSRIVSDRITLFGAVGRTLSKRDPNSAIVAITAGASIGFSVWQPVAHHPRP
jgi:hypothetical protein